MGEAQALRPGIAGRRLLDALLSVLLAPACAACGEPLDRPTAGAVCPACWSAVAPLTPPICDRCGMPMAGSSCGACARHPWAIERARAAGAYTGSLREIVHAFKYGGRVSLAAPLAAMMRAAAGDLLDGVDVAVPVPLHRSRQRERGFNQAELLARRLPLAVVSLLVRTRATPSQVDLPAERRARNVRGAFALRKTGADPFSSLFWTHGSSPCPAMPRTVLLVDDVATTGATLDECARVLLSAGVREVRALTAARAL